MKKLKFLLIPFFLLFVGAIFLFFFFSENNKDSGQSLENQNVTETPIQSEKVNITIDFGNNKAVYQTFDYQESQSAFGLLESLAEMELIEMETQQYDFGIFVKSINGKESSAEISWIYFVNGEPAQVAADQYKLKSGDVVEWKYIAPDSSL